MDSQCLFGDCREVLQGLMDEGVKVQTCVTSPPYWGLRDYGVKGQLGLEATPEEYVEKIVEVFRLVREVLADDGTLWLNLGDSYWGGKGQNGNTKARASAKERNYHQSAGTIQTDFRPQDGKHPNFKPKDLVGIPWRVAFALQADGWYLRSDIIWHKPNPMPESVTDRPTKAHEYIFLFSKQAKYYYDAEAVKETSIYGDHPRSVDSLYQAPGQTKHTGLRKMGIQRKPYRQRGHSRRHAGFDARWDSMTRAEQAKMGRNKRTVWTVATKPYSEAHFATFPPELITPCILAGARPGDLVLDPFFGSGTVGEVCEQLGRRWIGIELNREYEPLQKKRIAQMGLMEVPGG